MDKGLWRVAAFVLVGLAATPALASAPAATTTAATTITSSSAVLNGTGTPNGEATTGWFRYSTTSPGTCNDTFGTRLPATSGTDLGTGLAGVAYSITATGLTSGTTYYFCAIVSNGSGIAYGSLLSFTIPGVPAVTTSAASLVTSTTATLNGSANPLGATTTGWFRYSTTSPGTCNDTFGTRMPSTGGASLGSGASAVAYTQNLTGLTPGATYYYCALASNTNGTGFGAVVSFTMSPAAPTVSTNGVTALSGTVGTLNGTVNPGGATTTGWFRYDVTNPASCNDSFGTRAPASGGSSLGAGTTNTSYTQTLSGLTPGVTYFYCAIASNSVGTAFGAVSSFTAPLPPTVTTTAATNVFDTYGQLNGSGVPNNASTTAWFRYAATDPGTCNDTFGSRAPTSGGTALGSGTSAAPFYQTISGLSSGATYYYCAIAQNSEGTVFGSVMTLRTQGAPTAVTTGATGITSSAAQLNGSANPNAASTSGWFRYSTTNPGSCSDSFGTRMPSSGGASLGSGSSAVGYSQSLSGLVPGTTYYYCAIASNSYGISFGSVASFTMDAAAPTVSTSNASSLGGTTATLWAYVNPNAAATTVWYRYATVSPGTCNDSFGTRAPATSGVSAGTGNTNVNVSQAVAGFTPGTTYYYCAIANNSLGAAFGNVVAFTTPLPPVATTTAATNAYDTYAQLNGSGIPNGASATGWFRYSASDPGTCDDTFGSRIPTTGGTGLGTGSSAVTFYQTVYGLTAGSTYYYCAIVQTTEGTAFGSVMTLRTQGPPTATTTAASNITATTAYLNGSVNPNGATTTGWFRYSTTNPGTCSDSFGTRVPSSGSSPLGSGTSFTGYNQYTSSLTPGTTYYYCAIANNSLGAAFGSVLSFTTDIAAPTVTTLSPSPLGGTTATLRASVNPGAAATTAWFRYATVSPGTCNDTFGTRAPTTGGVSAGTGNTNITVTQAVSGLTPGATYYLCAFATNSAGTSFGTVLSFTTPLPPIATTTAATNVYDTYAQLNGSGIPNGSSSTGWFRYSATDPGTCDDVFGSRTPSTGGTGLGAGSTAMSFYQTISGLTSGATYYYCAIVQSAEGTSFGSVMTLRTLGPPTAVTAVPTVTATTAYLNGSVNPSGATTTGWFRYSTTNPGTCSDSFGTRAPSSGSSPLGSGTSFTGYNQYVTGLTPGTTYYYCAIASNSLGMAFGSVLSFTTDIAAPTVTTLSPSPLGGTAATLRASVNPGAAATTTWFRYATVSPGACNDTFGTRAPATGGVSAGTGNTTITVTQSASGLTPNTTYYLCAFATNSVGTAVGSVISFTTPFPPVATTTAATNVYDTYAQLNGSGIPNGASATGWFRYSASDPGTCDDVFGSRIPTTGGTGLGTGSSAVTFYQTVYGLTAGSTYYYCAIVQTSEGTAFGSVMTLRTQGPPTATTTAASSITATAAYLNGSVNPNGATTTGWFRYSTTNPGTCSDSFGTRVPSSGSSPLGSGTSFTGYNQYASGLTPGTTYYYCAIASNSLGMAFGSVLSFITDIAAPTVGTVIPSPLGGTTATLRAFVNPGAAATTTWFRYATVSPGACNDTFGTRAPTTGGVSAGSTNTTVTVTQAASDLVSGTTYYLCAFATNAAGTAVGSVVSFTTPIPPVATTTAATNVYDTYAQLNGTGIPNGSSSTGWFRYAATDPGTCDDNFGSRAPISGGTGLGAGTSAVSFYQTINGLTSGATYYYCAIVQSAEGTSFGAVMTLRTQGPPSAVTVAASAISSSSAVINGSVNPNGATSTGWLRYSTTNPISCNDTFGTRAPSSGGSALGSGTSYASYGQSIGGLSAATTYYFCAIASSSLGIAYGSVISFTTSAAAPTVTTNSPSSLQSTSAQFNATVNPGGAATTGWFRYDTVSPGTCNDTFGTRSLATGGVSLGSSSTNVSLAQTTTGLTPGQTLYVCAIASNSVGTTFGSVVSFTVPLMPTVASLAATPITATTATLNGSSNPNSYSATGWFRYSTTSPGSCNDTFGTRVPASGGTSLGSGSTTTTFNQALSGLTPGTLYYFCAMVTNQIGTVYGDVLSFTTPPIPPAVTTVAASGIVVDTAVLNATASPGGGASTGWFRYSTSSPGTCNDTFGTRTPASGGSDLGSGNSSVPYTATLTGLSAGTTYYFCAIVSNSVGTGFGSVLSFNTAVPSVTTVAATSVTNTGATLNGSANPNGTATTGWFRYSTTNPGSCNDTFGTRSPSTGGTSLGSGSTASAYSQTLTGLTAGTTYYFCAIASNTVGANVGTVLSFSTPGTPAVTTSAATSLTSTSAVLNGSANPNSSTATGWFRYDTTSPGSCNDTFGTRMPSSSGAALGAGTSAVAYTQSLTGLTPGTTYYYCAIASNSFGASVGSVISFTVPTAAPVVTTGSATPLTGTTARLDGSATPNGDTTTGWFRFDTTNPGTCNDTFGTRTPTTGGTALGSGNSAIPFTQSISALSAGTTYYFCALASNSKGTSVGPVLSFTMPSLPTATTAAATAITDTTATLNGAANPNGTATTGWFRYATSNPGVCSDTFGTRAPASGGSSLGSGTSSMSFSQALTGLTPNTTYYFCALSSNSVGMATGTVFSFRTPTLPSVTTNLATTVLASSATLSGTANPNGATATGWFRYSTTNPGTCNDTFGSRAPASGGASLGNGTSGVDYSLSVTGLTPGSVYYACAIASNSVGMSVGQVISFTTPSAVPIVTTVAASGFGPGTATLNATANPGGDSSTGWFRYAATDPGACDDAFGTRAPATGGTALGAGSSAVSYSQALSSLTPGATYYFCALASNSFGTATGTVLSFTMPSAPTVTTSATTSLTDTTATLNGAANPNGTATTGWFRYSATDPGSCNDTFGTRAPITGGSSLGGGSTSTSFSQAITGLTPNTTYYFCALASNTGGTATGTVLTFTTPSAPTVTTGTTTLITASSATLNGTANPNGADATGWFRYSTASPGTCNDSFGTRTPASGGTSLGSGTSAAPISQAITGLTPATTYYVCALASNTVGTSMGSVLSFTTPATVPAVTTLAASNFAAGSASLNASANPGGGATTGWFRYSTTNPGTCDDSFGTRAPTTGGSSLGSGTSSTSYTQSITGLVAGTTYYFCGLASNASGTTFGSVLSFTMPTLPTTVTSAATIISDTGATLNGAANPNGTTANGWFRYASTDPGSCNDTFGTRAPSSGGVALGAGSTSTTFSQSVTGLTPNTTYYFCALASNTGGISTGTVFTFKTTAPPTVVTSAATLVTASTATLNGTAAPNGTATTGWYRYDVTNPGTCNDSFGTRMPATGGATLGSSTSAVAYTQALSSLAAGMTYYFCAIASNASGTAFGTVLSFTTSPAAPTVVTNSPLSTTGSTATLSGSANPGGAAATGWFRYDQVSPGTCNDTFGTRAPTTGGSSLGSGSGNVSYSQAITGLLPGTTYYYCALASNPSGISVGSIVSFTTPSVPTTVTSAATAIADTSATLNGAANPNSTAATGWFRYSATNPGTCDDTFGTRLPSSGGVALGSGSTSTAYSQTLSGLTPNTTYYFCAIASNSGGTSTGTVSSFRTFAAPSVTTIAATLVTSSSATLNGSGNPNGAAATSWFRYSTTSPGTCNDTFGTRAPATGGSSLGSGTASTNFSQAITGLTPGATYYFCAIALNAYGTTTGSLLSFTAPAAAPVITVASATPLTSATARLDASANPGGDATTGWFRYNTTDPGTCNDVFGTRIPSTGGTSLGSGTTPAAFTQTLSGLTPGATYYYCALASNSAGASTGSVLSFTMPALPTTLTNPATSIADTTATLNGEANPNGTATTAWFRYSTTSPGSCDDTFGTRMPSSGGTSLGSGAASTSFSQTLTSLTPNTTYYFCALASNSGGVSTGTVASFRTSGAPSVTTNEASLVTSSAATLNGTATPNGASATAWFRYDTTNPTTCNDTFGTRAPGTAGAALGSGTSSVDFSQALSGLTPGTTYYFCAIASSTYGKQFGTVASFKTPAMLPTVTTTAATLLSGTSVQLKGAATPNGDAATGWFQYGTINPGTCSDVFGTRAPSTGGTSLGAGSTAVSFNQTLSTLQPGTTYYYCAVASNGQGTSFGQVLTFDTLPLPATVTSAATAIADTTATLNGAANPNGTAATGWFRYATNDPGACSDAFGTREPSAGGTSLGSGTSSSSFSLTLSGLTPNTTYYFCAIASNSAGISTGSVLTFRTPGVPSVTTDAASSVTSSAAILLGSANPNGASATAWFRYDTTNPTTCNDAFGTRAPATSGAALGSGNSAADFSQALSGLSPGTTYFFCAIASNAYGKQYGSVVSFKTPAMAPTVTMTSATLLSGTTAQLKGSATPNGDTATGWFQYGTINPGTCSDAFGSRAPTTGGITLGAGSVAVSFNQTVAGLQPGTTYYYCAAASNGHGTSFGQVLSFDTLPLANATTLPATQVSSTAATLNGSGTPNGVAATAWFRYSTASQVTCDDTFGTRFPPNGGLLLGAGTTAVPFSQPLPGLTAGTTYYYCAIIANSAGLAFGAVQSFSTTAVAGAPIVTTADAAGITTTGGTLNGTVDPNYDDTLGWFRFSATNPGSCNDTFGTRVPLVEGTAVPANSGETAYSETLDGLAPGTKYYFCAIASNGSGKRFGSVFSVVTPAAPPSVTTLAPTEVTTGAATLNGTATANGDASLAWFRYDTTDPGTCNDAFGIRAPAAGKDVGSGATATTISEAISGLTPGTRYYFCAIATNSKGTSVGEVLTFTPGSPAPTVTTEAASAVNDHAATLAGTANPNGTETLAWFRYGTVQPEKCSDSFGTRAHATGGTTIPVGTTAQPFTQPLDGLDSNATYYYCAVASNLGGATFGEVRSFKTSAVPPTVRTVGAASGANGSFTLNGGANPRGSETTVWFRYGSSDPGTCSNSFGQRTAEANDAKLGAGRTEAPFSQSVSGLPAGKTYFCAVASNEAGTVYGEVLSFEVASSTPREVKSGCNSGSDASSAAVLGLLPMMLLALRRQRRRA